MTWNAVKGATLAGPGKAWQTLPALPKRASTLALGSQVEVIVANGQTFREYQLASGGWSLAQTLHVQIPYGSSG